MTLNLNEARRLHDRDEYYPDKCGTCGDANAGTLANWPCPTATALGATGRSEWLDAPADPAGVLIEVCGNPNPAEDAYMPDGAPFICVAPPGHDGNHIDRDGDTW